MRFNPHVFARKNIFRSNHNWKDAHSSSHLTWKSALVFCRHESNSCGILSLTDWQTSTTIHAAKCHCQMLAGLNLINNHNLLLSGCTFNIDLTENQIYSKLFGSTWGWESNNLWIIGLFYIGCLEIKIKNCCFPSAAILQPNTTCDSNLFVGIFSQPKPDFCCSVSYIHLFLFHAVCLWFLLPTPGPYYNPRPRQRIPRDLAMCVTPSGQFYCSMCNCGAEQETDFRQHLESKQHKAKVSELRYRHEMENLGYS